MRVSREANGGTSRGTIAAYDAELGYWHVKWLGKAAAERMSRKNVRKVLPSGVDCAAVPSASEADIAAYISTREPGERDWYLRDDSGFAPYQQRQFAQLATSSDYAAARGKRGGGERRLCTCAARRVESTEHVVLECEIYSAQRKPLAEAISEWRASMRGFSARAALRWAIDNKMPAPVMPTEGRTAAGAALRAALLDFHRQVKSVQYSKPRDAAPQPPAVN